MREYELITLFPPAEEDGAEALLVDKVKGLVEGNGGTVTSVHKWGRRKLAYKIGDLAEAVYLLCKVQMDPEKTADLETGMRLDRELLRHLLVHDHGGQGPVAPPGIEEVDTDG